MNHLENLRAARLFLHRQWTDVDSLIRGNIGLHSTDYASPYLSAWARLPRFDPADLFKRLNTGQGLVRINSMRNTVHVVHTDDLPLIAAATGDAVRQVGRRIPALRPLSDTQIRAGLEQLYTALEPGPLDNNALKAALPSLAETIRYWLMMGMGEGQILRADAAHARSNRSRFALSRQWVPGFLPGEVPAAEARIRVLGRAVEAFGPVTEADLAWWLPATKTEVTKALKAMGRSVSSLESEGQRYWFPAALADVVAPPRSEAGAWLLPYEDGLLKGYQDRSWLLEPNLKPVIFPYNVGHWRPPAGVDPGPGPHGGVNVSGEARPSVWWGGRIVGRWEEAEEGVVWQLHVDLEDRARTLVEAEIGRLNRFLKTEFGLIGRARGGGGG